MAVVCEGQLLLLTQPTDGPVTEPIVLGSVPITEVLVDDNVRFTPRSCPFLGPVFQHVNSLLLRLMWEEMLP